MAKKKYGNKRRYLELVIMQLAGSITDLKTQVEYVLCPSVVIDGLKRPAIRYIADFVYTDDSGKTVVEDCKGMLTPVYKLKRHLMMYFHGIKINEIFQK